MISARTYLAPDDYVDDRYDTIKADTGNSPTSTLELARSHSQPITVEPDNDVTDTSFLEPDGTSTVEREGAETFNY